VNDDKLDAEFVEEAQVHGEVLGVPLLAEDFPAELDDEGFPRYWRR